MSSYDSREPLPITPTRVFSAWQGLDALALNTVRGISAAVSEKIRSFRTRETVLNESQLTARMTEVREKTSEHPRSYVEVNVKARPFSEQEMAGWNTQLRADSASMRANTVSMESFFYPTRVTYEDNNLVVKSVSEPTNVPSDEVVANYLAARASESREAAKLAHSKGDVGAGNAAEGMEMRYMLALRTLKGETADTPRGDLLVSLMKDEAKRFLLLQDQMRQRAAMYDGGKRESSFNCTADQIEGSVDYILRTAEELSKRFVKE